MKTALFFTERQINLLTIITEQEIKSFGDKNNYLAIEYQDILNILIVKGVKEIPEVEEWYEKEK